jgi:hypothetical protein
MNLFAAVPLPHAMLFNTRTVRILQRLDEPSLSLLRITACSSHNVSCTKATDAEATIESENVTAQTAGSVEDKMEIKARH